MSSYTNRIGDLPKVAASSLRTTVSDVGSIRGEAVPRASILLAELSNDVVGRSTAPRTNREHATAAVEWLYRAQDATDGGGCASAYNLVLGWGGPYPETTGYIVPTLYDYANRYGSAEARDRAELMASWLLETQFNSGAFPKGDDPETETDPSVFNTGQILFGLVRAYEETGDERYREASRRAGEWLVSVQHPNGYWNRFDYNGVVHSYSSRVGWALLEAADCTGEQPFRAAAKRNLEWVIDQQHDNGWFGLAGFDTGDVPFLHTIAYTIRGVLEGSQLLDDGELLERVRLSADSLLEEQRHRGILRGALDENFDGPEFYCLTGNAQMAVVWYRLFQLTGETAYRSAADRTVRFLKRKQRMGGRPEVRGGLKGSDPVWQRYMYLRYPNWAAKFLVDALLLADAVRDE